MEPSPELLIDLLLRTSSSVVLHLDPEERVRQIAGGPALAQWLPHGPLPCPGSTLADALGTLFDEAHTARILQQYHALQAGPIPASTVCPMLAARPMRLAATRWFDVTCARLGSDQSAAALVLITDRTLQQQLADFAATNRAAHELALTVLRTDIATLRQFLQTANSAIGFIRATLRQPARTQQALRDKLALLRAEAVTLGSGAERLTLRNIAAPCQTLTAELDTLLAKETLSGDDMLPLALRMDPISAAIGAALSLDQQRATPAPLPVMQAAGFRAALPRPAAAWHEICEQRANDLIQRLGTRHGVLARMRMKGSALVPERYHRQIEAVMEPLLSNALKHGIETPEQRLAADKPAAGTITITFRNRDAAGLEMTVHDDGRGFDLARIQAAAIASGLLEVNAGEEPDPRALVGMIFRPGFSTVTLAQLPGEGQGMALLRESLHRQGGSVSVATKPLRYTQFTLRLPARDAVAARQRPSRHDSPGMGAPQP